MKTTVNKDKHQPQDGVENRTALREMEQPVINPRLLEILVCPLTRETLEYSKANQELISRKAGLAFPIRDGIPIMLLDEARKIEN